MLKGDIFCFGGIRGNFTTSDATDTTMFMLDLSKNATMAELAGNWTLIHPNTNGVNVETRQNPQFAQISDTQIVFNGGFGGAADNMPLTDQTIVYDAESNSWSKYPAYTEGSFGQRQMYKICLKPVPLITFYQLVTMVHQHLFLKKVPFSMVVLRSNHYHASSFDH